MSAQGTGLKVLALQELNLKGQGPGGAEAGRNAATKTCAGWLIVPNVDDALCGPTSCLDAAFPKEIFTVGATEDSNRPLG
jgi:hypothetical protein